MVKDVVSKELLNTDGNTGDKNLQKFTFQDTLGTKLTGRVESMLGMSIEANNSGLSKEYDEVLANHMEQVKKKIQKNKNISDEQAKKIETAVEMSSILKYLTMCDINDGWEVRPGWRAPLAPLDTNIAIRNLLQEKNLYAKEVKTLRANAIKAIDAILDKPLKYRNGEGEPLGFYQRTCEIAVNNMFDSEEGKDLLDILFYGMNFKKLNNGFPSAGTSDFDIENSFGKNYFKYTDPLKYMAGFLYASGCALSGSEEFRSQSSVSKWRPNHYAFASDISCLTFAEDEPKTYMPYIEGERGEGRSQLATTLSSGIPHGVCYGAWRITKYPSSEAVGTIMGRHDDSIQYIGPFSDQIYKDKDDKDKKSYSYINQGYLDPYYNHT
ncbi:hypothetical protein [Paraclostridium dentum]|uniref:hypothetical protein n=1 Tax=Paraclostridium dentum TaxID=2662455 RepID=UPI003F3FA0A2